MLHIKDSVRKYKKELDTLVKLKQSQEILFSLLNGKAPSNGIETAAN
jgi:hypothetical protein